MRTTLAGALVLLTAAAHPAAYLYDMGTAKSAVMEGFAPVTPAEAFTAERGFGWNVTESLKAFAQAYRDPIENKSRGTMDPPPIYTNPLTEDCVVGERQQTLRIAVPAGEWRVYALCGASHDSRYQYWDFDVAVGEQVRRVRIEGSYQFRNLRLAARTMGEPLDITFNPRSKWLVNAVMVWNQAEDARVEALIQGLEDQVYGLPPEEMAKWKLEEPPPTGPLPELSETDRQRGFVLYHRPYCECIYPNTNPRAGELDPTLRIFASPGEYEPLTFEVRTLAALQGVQVTPSDLGPIAANTIDVRHVRYMRARPNYTIRNVFRIVPDVLERFETLDLPADESHRFWLTGRVPEDAAPGQYEGSIEFRANGHHVSIPVRLRVLPIALREDPDKLYGIYYRDPLERWRNAVDEVSKQYFRRKAELERADMVAHGTRNITLSAWCREADAEGKFTADWMTLQAQLDLNREYGFRGPYVVNINTGGVYRKYMGESFGSHLRGLKMPPPEFFDEMTRMTAFIESERRRNGWPEFLYYPIDEPSGDATSVQFMTELLKAVQAAGVKTYVTADPTREAFWPMRPYVNVWCTQPFAPDRETVLKDMAERDVLYWCYPNHVNGENDHTTVSGARMTYGFGFWRSGFKTLIPWIYQASTGDPFNYLDGATSDFFNRSEEDGTPMPVAMWEAYREGYDDYRYVYTLECAIREARAAGRDAAADAAEKDLRAVWDAIRVQEKYKYEDLWPAEEYDVYRWIVARAILRLQAAG